uniref:L-type lectin-like domain-containing protein n=1 Tax=Malurus cyaneus samueli TaxID=2593467 RepID=A0A8C5X315_9PASS
SRYPTACVPLHLGHGEQRLADVRPRPRRAPHGAGRLHGPGAQPQPRHLPGHPLRQEEAHGEFCPFHGGFSVPRVPVGLREPLPRQVLIDIDGKHEWRDCIDVPGVRLPRGYYFGTSSVTGDLSDNHDIISLKLYQLTVERTPEEEKRDREVFLPRGSNLKLLGVSGVGRGMEGI